MDVRRISIQPCCDLLLISAIGSGLVYNHTYAMLSRGNLTNVTLYFTQPTLNVSLFTDATVAHEGFELELSPYTGIIQYILPTHNGISIKIFVIRSEAP